MIEQKFSLELTKNGVQRTIYAKQGENGARTLSIAFTASGKVVSLTGYTLRIYYDSLDGTTSPIKDYAYSGTVANPIEIVVPDYLCQYTGEHIVGIKFTKNTEVVFSPEFSVIIDSQVGSTSGSVTPPATLTYQPLIAGLDNYDGTLDGDEKVPVYDPDNGTTKNYPFYDDHSNVTSLLTRMATAETNITTEANARASADTALQTNITTEATTRTNADTTLQANITNEATARAAADTALDTAKVDKVSGKGLSTNDYDDTEKANVASNTSARHTHSNKALLDTYAQTEANLADAVNTKHSHSNKSLLDTYTQTEANLADAVSTKHSHSNKSTLDTYTKTQTEIEAEMPIKSAIEIVNSYPTAKYTGAEIYAMSLAGNHFTFQGYHCTFTQWNTSGNFCYVVVNSRIGSYTYKIDSDKAITVKDSSLFMGAEYTSNKVTSLSASSTDTQYPSAKAVYDELSAQSAEIETLGTGITNEATARASADTALSNRVSILEQDMTRYGVKYKNDVSSTAMTRIWDSVGKTANMTTNGEAVVNDFDSIYPWSEMRVCNISVGSDGTITVNAYRGDADFKRDGTNGQVVVEIPEFYGLCYATDADGYEYRGVSRYQWNSSWHHFKKRYIACYDASANGSGLCTYSGTTPLVNTNLAGFRTKAQATDSQCQIMDIEDYEAVCLLFDIEFATKNSQATVQGLTNVGYNAEHTISSVTSETEFVCANASSYTAGQNIAIGTAKNGTQRTASVKISAISGTTITLASAVSGLTAGDYISSRASDNGWNDGLSASSGSYSTDAKHPISYRGIENVYGNVYQWIDGLLVQDRVPYICTDKTKFSSSITSNYTALSYTNCDTNGYPKELNNDDDYPYCRMPKTVGGSSSTYWADYYYQNTGLRGVSVGGGFSSGSGAGFRCFSASYAPSVAYVYIGARCSWKSI